MSSAKRSARTSPLPLLRAIVPVALGAVLLVSATSVLAAPPTVSVALDPAFPQADEPVTFTATAADPDGLAITRVEWDFDGNGVWGRRRARCAPIRSPPVASSAWAPGLPTRLASRR